MRPDETPAQDMVAVRPGAVRGMVVEGPTSSPTDTLPTSPDDPRAHARIGTILSRGTILPWFPMNDGRKIAFSPRDRLSVGPIEGAIQGRAGVAWPDLDVRELHLHGPRGGPVGDCPRRLGPAVSRPVPLLPGAMPVAGGTSGIRGLCQGGDPRHEPARIRKRSPGAPPHHRTHRPSGPSSRTPPTVSAEDQEPLPVQIAL